MYNASLDFKNYIKMPSRTLSSRLVVGPNTYTDIEIVDMSLESNLVPGEEFTLGITICNKFEATIMTNNLIQVLNVIRPYIGLDINETVEEVPLGVFNVDDVVINKNTKKIIAYDNMIKFEKAYFSDLVYPATIQNVASEICQKAGVSFNSMLPNYTLDAPIEGKTLREAIGIIAGICGGFARINRTGALEIAGLTSTDINITLENFFGSIEKADKDFTIKKITAIREDNSTISSGSGLASEEITFSNNYITQVQLDSILAIYNNYSYRPIKMTWQGNPALDVGDKITVTDVDNTVYTIPVMRLKLTYSGGLKSEIASIAKSDSKSEYNYKGTLTTKVENIVTEQANIRNLLAEKVSAEELEAVNARIDNLRVNTAMIEDASITTAKIANGAIDNAKIANASIDSAKIQNGAITTALIGTGAVGTAQIKDGSITDAKIVSLTANKITAGTLDANTVNIVNLKADNITTGALTIDGDNLIHNTAWLNDTSYWTLGSGWVRDTSTKFDTSYTMKVDVSGETANKWYAIFSEFIPATEGQRFVASGYVMTNDKTTIDANAELEIEWYDDTTQITTTGISIVPSNNNVWQRFVISGTAPTGTTRVRIRFHPVRNGRFWVARPMLQRGSVASEWKPHTDEQITDGAITNTKLANNAVDSNKIASGAVTNTHIAANTITGDKLVADAITSREIAAGAVTANELAANAITAGSAVIADGAITTAKIADAAITNAKIDSLDASKITTGTLDASKVNVVNLNASNITTGTMSANKIYGGTLTLGGTNNSNGVLSIKDASGVIKAKGDANGFFVLDEGVNITLESKNNLIPDHSFEAIPTSGSADATYYDVAVGTLSGNMFDWNKGAGSPRILSARNTDITPEAAFGMQCAVVNFSNWFQIYVPVKPGTTYYVSGYTARGYRNPSAGTPRIGLVFQDYNLTTLSSKSLDFTPNTAQFDWKRVGFSFTTPTNTAYVKIIPYAADSNYVYWDGIQLVEGAFPAKYESEENLWRHIYGVAGLQEPPSLGWNIAFSWSGSISPNTSVTITHNLGCTPIVMFDGTIGNLILTWQTVNANTIRVYNYNAASNTWNGTVRLY